MRLRIRATCRICLLSSLFFFFFFYPCPHPSVYTRRTHFPSGPAKLPLDVVQLPSEFRKKGVDMSGRNDFLPGSARSILTAELMASPDVKVRRSNKELFGKGLPAFFHVVGSYAPSTFHQISSTAGHPRGEKLRLSISGSVESLCRGMEGGGGRADGGNYTFAAFYCVTRRRLASVSMLHSMQRNRVRSRSRHSK